MKTFTKKNYQNNNLNKEGKSRSNRQIKIKVKKNRNKINKCNKKNLSRIINKNNNSKKIKEPI